MRNGLILADPTIDATLREQPLKLTTRSAQRRFLQATGLTRGAIRQIERARHATHLLNQGASILDAVYEAGYYDQAHLTRSLKRLIGQTPAQISRAESAVVVFIQYEADLIRYGVIVTGQQWRQSCQRTILNSRPVSNGVLWRARIITGLGGAVSGF